MYKNFDYKLQKFSCTRWLAWRKKIGQTR